MLIRALNQCNEALLHYPCCKTDGTECNCLSSLKDDYYNRADTYNCHKKMNTYVLRFGLAYASEIYNYLSFSKFKNKFDLSKPLNVKSLGCGFSPDYYALKQYFQNQNIQTQINYIGLDSGECWNLARPNDGNCSYPLSDLTTPFDLSNTDVVFISKVFSTLYKNDNGSVFLLNLENAIKQTLKTGALIVFIDINTNKMGRDQFHSSVSKYLPNFNQYYFGGYSGYNWLKINENEMVFPVPPMLSIEPLTSTGQTVVFEYRK